MKRNILLAVVVVMIGLMVFTNVDHIMWIREYATNTGFSWTEELFPLLINNIIWLSVIPLFLIWLAKKDYSNLLLGMMIITVVVQLATTIYARVADDPLAAGLPFVIVTIPLSVILLIYSVKELRA